MVLVFVFNSFEDIPGVRTGVFSLVLSMRNETISYLFRMKFFDALLSPNELVSLETKRFVS